MRGCFDVAVITVVQERIQWGLSIVHLVLLTTCTMTAIITVLITVQQVNRFAAMRQAQRWTCGRIRGRYGRHVLRITAGQLLLQCRSVARAIHDRGR